mmetsp:Transcript_4722/g.14006  ORF Transcript_4722/g.14006 Transcript_4722/m.14006 type:complete len:133 (+) Transcript_4722:264-662(+)
MFLRRRDRPAGPAGGRRLEGVMTSGPAEGPLDAWWHAWEASQNRPNTALPTAGNEVFALVRVTRGPVEAVTIFIGYPIDCCIPQDMVIFPFVPEPAILLSSRLLLSSKHAAPDFAVGNGVGCVLLCSKASYF